MGTPISKHVAIPLTHLPRDDAKWREATRLVLTPHDGSGCETHIYAPSNTSSSVDAVDEFRYAGIMDRHELAHARVSAILVKRQAAPLSLRVPDLISPLLKDEIDTTFNLSELATSLGIPLGSAVPIIHLSGSPHAPTVSSGLLLIPSIVHSAERDAFLWNMCSGVAACLHSIAGRDDSLSPRPNELECIRWAVAGKTLREIAKITGFNYRTVRFYIDSARERYGYATNTQLYVRVAQDYNLEPLGSPREVSVVRMNGAAGAAI